MILFIYIFIYLFIHLFIFLFIYLFIYLIIYLFQKHDYLKKSHDCLKLCCLDFIIIYNVILQQTRSIAFTIILTASIYK